MLHLSHVILSEPIFFQDYQQYFSDYLQFIGLILERNGRGVGGVKWFLQNRAIPGSRNISYFPKGINATIIYHNSK